MYSVLFTPGITLVVGLLVFVGIAVFSRRSAPSTTRPWLTRLALLAPVLIVIPLVVRQSLPYVDLGLRYLAGSDVPSPGEGLFLWEFAGPTTVALICAAVALARIAAERNVVEEPVTPVVRRGWRTFARTRDIVIAASTLGLLQVTGIAAGASSSPDDNGWYIRFDTAVGNTSSGSFTFFGWAFVIPALLSAGLLVVLVLLALRRDAARPFVRSSTVAAESAERRTTASVLLRLVTAPVLLVLGSAWILIGQDGLIVADGDFFTTYSAFAPAILIAGFVLQTAGVVLLLLTMRMRPRVSAKAPAPQAVAA